MIVEARWALVTLITRVVCLTGALSGNQVTLSGFWCSWITVTRLEGKRTIFLYCSGSKLSRNSFSECVTGILTLQPVTLSWPQVFGWHWPHCGPVVRGGQTHWPVIGSHTCPGLSQGWHPIGILHLINISMYMIFHIINGQEPSNFSLLQYNENILYVFLQWAYVYSHWSRSRNSQVDIGHTVDPRPQVYMYTGQSSGHTGNRLTPVCHTHRGCSRSQSTDPRNSPAKEKINDIKTLNQYSN